MTTEIRHTFKEGTELNDQERARVREQIRRLNQREVAFAEVIGNARQWDADHSPFDRTTSLPLFQYIIERPAAGLSGPAAVCLKGDKMNDSGIEFQGLPEGRMVVVCSWHMRNFGHYLIMGFKDGEGVTGTTGGICPKCKKIEEEKLQLAAAQEAEKVEAERQEKAAFITKNPGLHARCMVQGEEGNHFLFPPLRELLEAAKDEPEVKCKWN